MAALDVNIGNGENFKQSNLKTVKSLRILLKIGYIIYGNKTLLLLHLYK